MITKEYFESGKLFKLNVRKRNNTFRVEEDIVYMRKNKNWFPVCRITERAANGKWVIVEGQPEWASITIGFMIHFSDLTPIENTVL